MDIIFDAVVAGPQSKTRSSVPIERSVSTWKLMRLFAGIAVAMLSTACASAPASKPTSEFAVISDDAYAPAGSRRLVVHSGILGRDFVVVVTSPPAAMYGVKVDWTGKPKLPAIYALDGGYGIAGPLAQMMASQGVMGPSYVVSISYPEGSGESRSIDLLFRKAIDSTGTTIGGGGQTYADFLTKELKPYLEQRFAMDPARGVLFGHSFGGLFALNVLASQPDAFDRYIIASPSTMFDADLMTALPQAVQKVKGKRVYMAVAGNEAAEMLTGADKAASVLKAAGVKVENRVFANENHISYYVQLVPAAFAWILPPESAGAATAVVTQAQLERLIGAYNFNDGRVATFTIRDSKLVARMTNLPGDAVLDAQSPTRFAIIQFGVVMTFDGAENGPAAGVTIRINGADSHGTRQK